MNTTPFKGYDAKINGSKIRVVNQITKASGQVLLKVRAYLYSGVGSNGRNVYRLGTPQWVRSELLAK